MRLGWLLAREFEGQAFTPESTVQEAGLGSTTVLQALVVPVLIQTFSTSGSVPAYARLYGGGTVETEGPEHMGADSRHVQSQLHDVVHIASTSTAFAAQRRDGTVVTWGLPTQGGDSEGSQGQLTDVVSIVGTDRAFTALRRDGTVVCWGDDLHVRDFDVIRGELRGVQQLAACSDAFAAVLHTGRVVMWGEDMDGATRVRGQLLNVRSATR